MGMTNLIFVFLSFTSDTNKASHFQTLQTTKMSSTTLKIISTEPSYLPSKEIINDAKILLKKFHIDDQIEFVTTDTIEFVDQGENFESVSCNLCGYNIEIEDWQYLMDQAHENQFTNLSFTTSCCHKINSLNDLIYKSPAGFAKFIINISDAEDKIKVVDFKKMQDILGTTLRIIWAHY